MYAKTMYLFLYLFIHASGIHKPDLISITISTAIKFYFSCVEIHLRTPSPLTS